MKTMKLIVFFIFIINLCWDILFNLWNYPNDNSKMQNTSASQFQKIQTTLVIDATCNGEVA